MRKKMVTKKDKEKREKRNRFIFGVLLVLVMVFSTLGYAFRGIGDEPERKTIDYNGYELVNQNGYWLMQKGNKVFGFAYSPKEISVEDLGLSAENYLGKTLYIYSENPSAEMEIWKNFDGIAERIQRACVSEEQCNGDYPIKSCEDDFIIIQEAESRKIEKENKCVKISGGYENLTKYSDEFMYGVFT